MGFLEIIFVFVILPILLLVVSAGYGWFVFDLALFILIIWILIDA